MFILIADHLDTVEFARSQTASGGSELVAQQLLHFCQPPTGFLYLKLEVKSVLSSSTTVSPSIQYLLVRY